MHAIHAFGFLATRCSGCCSGGLFSSALAFASVRFKSCSCLSSSRCLRTRAHTSTSPAALTDRSEIASTLSLSLGFKPCLYSSRPRPRSFASSWTRQHFSPALHPQRSPPLPAVSHFHILTLFHAPLLSTYVSLHTTPTSSVNAPQSVPHRLTLFCCVCLFVIAVPL